MNLSSPLSNDKEVENEVEIIKSKNVLEKIVSDLYLNQTYTKNNFLVIQPIISLTLLSI